jgi:hypothetical protein
VLLLLVMLLGLRVGLPKSTLPLHWQEGIKTSHALKEAPEHQLAAGW